MSEKQTQQGEKVDKPWGYELIWATTRNYVAKVLFIRGGESLSLQYHQMKEETIFLESGECLLEVGDNESQLEKIHLIVGDAYHIPPGRIHRMSARSDCRIFEVSTPFLDDVVRLRDKYGRV